MASGKYDQRIEVLVRSITQNAQKEDVETWECGKKLWAEVMRGSGGERRVGAAQEQANLPVTVTVRFSKYTSCLKPQDNRLAFDGFQWDIESSAEGKSRNREIIMIARARIK